MFIMLIFVIVTASFIKETGLDVSSPDALKDRRTESVSVMIAIDDANRIWIDGRLIDPRAVRANIERRRAEHPDAGVVIQAEKHSSNQTLVQVMDASRMAGVDDFSLAKGPSSPYRMAATSVATGWKSSSSCSGGNPPGFPWA